MSVVFSFAFDLFSHPNGTPLKEKLSREKCHEGKGETFFFTGWACVRAEYSPD